MQDMGTTGMMHLTLLISVFGIITTSSCRATSMDTTSTPDQTPFTNSTSVSTRNTDCINASSTSSSPSLYCQATLGTYCSGILLTGTVLYFLGLEKIDDGGSFVKCINSHGAHLILSVGSYLISVGWIIFDILNCGNPFIAWVIVVITPVYVFAVAYKWFKRKQERHNRALVKK